MPGWFALVLGVGTAAAVIDMIRAHRERRRLS